MHLDSAPSRVGEKVEGADVAVLDVKTQQEVQLSHIYLLTHQQQLKEAEPSRG